MKSLLERNFPMSSAVITLRFFVPLDAKGCSTYSYYMKVLVVEEDEIISLSNHDCFLLHESFNISILLKKINQYGKL